MIYRESTLCHFNPNHDPENGRFTSTFSLRSKYTRITEKPKTYKRRRLGNSIYNKKHFDTAIKKGETMSTLSYDPNRTVGADMFYAAVDKLDKHQYNSLFNRPIDKTIYDENGKPIGTGKFFKYQINNAAKNDIKVASEDSASKIFFDMFRNDRDFYDFVMDDDRMEKHFVSDKYKFKGYREARDVLHKLDDKTYIPSDKEVKTLYRMFNYVIPSQGTNQSEADDVVKQRAKFFKACSDAGYGAILDTNDGIYGGFKASNPVIVFDQSSVIPKNVRETKMSEKMVSDAALAVRKFLHI